MVRESDWLPEGCGFNSQYKKKMPEVPFRGFHLFVVSAISTHLARMN